MPNLMFVKFSTSSILRSYLGNVFFPAVATSRSLHNIVKCPSDPPKLIYAISKHQKPIESSEATSPEPRYHVLVHLHHRLVL